jgi:thymidylate kinase
MYLPNVVIEGGDLTGKTTLQKTLLKEEPITKEIFVSDRSIMTRMAYNVENKIKKELNEIWKKDLMDFLTNNAMLFLQCEDVESIKKRFFTRNDENYSLEKILEIHKEYNKIYNTYLSNLPCVKNIDTSKNNFSQTIAISKNFIKNIYKNYSIGKKIENLIHLTLAFGDNVKDTKEIKNIRIQHLDLKQFCDEDLQTLIDRMYDYSLKEDNSRYKMDIENDKYFYDAMLKNLEYVIKKELVFLKSDYLTCRRFSIVNPQGSCVISMGINFRKQENSDSIDMYITSHIRSSDVVILPFDISGIKNIVKKIIEPKTSKELFGIKKILPIQNFYYNIDIESLHIIDPEKFIKEYFI